MDKLNMELNHLSGINDIGLLETIKMLKLSQI